MSELSRMVQEAEGTVVHVASIKPILLACGLLAAVVAGSAAWVGYKVGQPRSEDISPAPAVIQADGSVVAERAREARLPSPPHALPKGSIEERRVQVVVKPKATTPTPDGRCDPAPVEVDMSIVRAGEGRRVVASTPDGTVVKALDIPIEAAPLPDSPKPWAAGLSYGRDHSVGAWVERDLGPVRVGLDVIREQTGGTQARLRAGLSW